MERFIYIHVNKLKQEKDKQIAVQNKIKAEDQKNLKLIYRFVKFLPKSFIKNVKNEDGVIDDSQFYFQLGAILSFFGRIYDKQSADKVEILIDSPKYEDLFFELLSKKYGERIEW